MSVWSNVGSIFSGLTSAALAAGVSVADAPAAVAAMFKTLNPNESDEMAICGQILEFAGNPAMVAPLAQKLALDQGIPVAAASLAMTLATPGVNVVQTVEEIETIIRNGG